MTYDITFQLTILKELSSCGKGKWVSKADKKLLDNLRIKLFAKRAIHQEAVNNADFLLAEIGRLIVSNAPIPGQWQKRRGPDKKKRSPKKLLNKPQTNGVI